jgi:hypothetical protein
MVHGIKHIALFTSHAPWVQLVVLIGVVYRQTGGSMSAEGGGGRGETMPARQTQGGGGEGTLARVYISYRRLWRKEGRLDQAREGKTGGRGCRKSFREVRKVNLLG